MADEIKKYRIQQKTNSGVNTLHPETQADIVLTTQIDDAEGKKLIDAGNAQTVLTTLARNINTATKGAVNDVKVKDGDGAAESVVSSGIATIDISNKVDKVAGKGLSTNDYDDTAKNAVANIANKVDKVDGKGLSTNDYTADEKTKLSNIEAQAQVNKIETIKVNGTAQTITDKAVNITIDAQAVYTIAKETTAESGYAATYKLTKDGTQVGASINIPKDMVVESGTVETCTEADKPVEGYKVGDKYIDLVIANKTSSHLYILVSDLIDVYTEGSGIKIANNQISVDTTAIATKKSVDDIVDGTTTVAKATAATSASQLADGTNTVTAAQAKTVITTVGDTASGLVKDVKDLKDAGATKVEASETNGNIKINDTETTVYTEVENTVHDANYKHITVTSTSVSDGTTTFNKYDDTALAGKVSALETTIDTKDTGLKDRVTVIENKFTTKAAGTFSCVKVNSDGIVTEGGNLIEVGTEATANLVTGGIFFKEI